MTGKMARNKGANGEREAKALLLEWIGPVYRKAGLEPPEVQRNLMQSRQGGYDLVGLDWLALEVKRQEQVGMLGTWWKQAVRQAGEGQIPFLMWRPNRSPWRFRTVVVTFHGDYRTEWFRTELVVDLSREEAKKWIEIEAWSRIRSLSEPCSDAAGWR